MFFLPNIYITKAIPHANKTTARVNLNINTNIVIKKNTTTTNKNTQKTNQRNFMNFTI
jgi:hypothetical protein